MAALLVSDTSVLIDLRRGHLLEALFKLPFEIGVPDLLFERELSNWDGPALEPLGLKVLVLEADGVALAQSYRAREPRLSVPDAFALALAKLGGHVLLAGDRSLRDLADAERVKCHGVLWVLDSLEAHELLRPTELLAALEAISSHPRCRLPAGEVQRRTNRFRRAAAFSRRHSE